MTVSGTLLSGKRCLVLDDEFLIALDIQQTLELAGAAYVAAVATVPEALRLLRSKPDFNLAVLDVKLSGRDPKQSWGRGFACGKRHAIHFLDWDARRRCAFQTISPRARNRKTLRRDHALERRASSTGSA